MRNSVLVEVISEAVERVVARLQRDTIRTGTVTATPVGDRVPVHLDGDDTGVTVEALARVKIPVAGDRVDVQNRGGKRYVVGFEGGWA